MFIKRDLIIVLVALMAAALIAGCSAVTKESGGDQTGAGGGLIETAEYVGLDNCYSCHGQTTFRQWTASRHANFDLEDGTRVDYADMLPAGSNTPASYFSVTGDPNRFTCDPCHSGPDDGGYVLDANYFGDYFFDPNIGQVARPIISCEACHGGGSFHYGVGALPYPQPGFDVCAALCHDFNYEEEPAYGSHHYVDSDRYWYNAGGDSAHDAHDEIDSDSDHVPVSVADTTIASVAFSVWSLPAPADSSWLSNYQGPYFQVPDRTIRDTHFNEIWILNEQDKVTVYKTPTAKLGYVRLENDSPNTGMVNANDPESCTASCHDPHAYDLTIQLQWANGAHRPYPQGPIVVNEDGLPFPSGPVSWNAVDHGFSSSCLRCHTSVGFAELNGDIGSTNVWPDGDGFITCNACHDGVNYPSAANARLRLDGDAILFDNDAGDGTARLVIEDAGASATCMYCHQGRESGLSIENAIAEADTHSRFINRHYLAAAAIQYGSEATAAYQYSGQTYAGANTFADHGDALSLCTDCHLRGTGDHTFLPQITDCNGCHTEVTSDFEELGESDQDYDGDGGEESFHDEVVGMQEILLTEIYAYADSVIGVPIVYGPGAYPYFFIDDGDGIFEPDVDEDSYDVFDDRLLAAAFNYHSGLDPCGYIHNHRYVIQSLYDSADDLDDGLLNESIQGNRP